MDRAEGARIARITYKNQPKKLREALSDINPPDRFAQELAAYNRLVQAGVCQTAEAPVPRPLGWFEIPDYNDPFWRTRKLLSNDSPSPKAASTLETVSSSDKSRASKRAMPYETWLAPFKYEMRPRRALLLEYIPDAKAMSPSEMTAEQVRTLFDGLRKIHGAGMSHGDIAARNILMAGSRVVFTDFESSVLVDEEGIARPAVFAWEMDYLFELLADAFRADDEEIMVD